MKKRNIFVSVLVIFIVVLITYPLMRQSTIKEETKIFLQSQGCIEKDIKSIKVKYSYLNHILSYDQWSILVEFTAMPDVKYSFTKRDGAITFRGLFDSQKNKEGIKELEDKYYNGQLCDLNR